MELQDILLLEHTDLHYSVLSNMLWSDIAEEVYRHWKHDFWSVGEPILWSMIFELVIRIWFNSMWYHDIMMYCGIVVLFCDCM